MISEEDLRKHKIQWAENQGTLQKISCQRAQFAAMAMQGLLAGDTRDKIGEYDCQDVAEVSVRYADALIEELKK